MQKVVLQNALVRMGSVVKIPVHGPGVVAPIPVAASAVTDVVQPSLAATPESQEEYARKLWQSTKTWADISDASEKQEWNFDRQEFNNWHAGHDMSLATTTKIRQKIQLVHVKQFVGTVKELRRNSYWREMLIDKGTLDDWLAGTLISADITAQLIAQGKVLCLSGGIVYEDVKRTVEMIRRRLPNTYLQDLHIDTQTLDAWISGETVTSRTTAKLRHYSVYAQKKIVTTSAY